MTATRELARRLASALADRRQALALLVLALAAAAVWSFVELADEVLEGQTRALDTRILLALRDPANPDEPLGPQWVEELGRDITALGGWGVLALITAVAVGYLVLQGRRHMAALVVASVGLGQALSLVLKHGIDRPRPDLVPHGSFVYTASFPSGHAMMAAITYLTLAALLMRVEPRPLLRAYLLGVALLVTVLVGVSRVYLGVHWPTDVLAGWAMGAAWALLWSLAAFLLQRRGREEGVAAGHDGPS